MAQMRPKRQAIKQITPRARQLFRDGVRLIGWDTDELKKPELDLIRELGLKPWHPTPFEVHLDEEMPKDLDPHHREFWQFVHDLCEEMKEGS